MNFSVSTKPQDISYERPNCKMGIQYHITNTQASCGHPDEWSAVVFVTRGEVVYDKAHQVVVRKGSFLLLQKEADLSSLKYEPLSETITVYIPKLSFVQLLHDRNLDSQYTAWWDHLCPVSDELQNLIAALHISPRIFNELNFQAELVRQICWHFEQEVVLPFLRINCVRSITRLDIFTRLLQAKDYLNSNVEEDLSIKKLSSIAMMSASNFLKNFELAFVVSPHRYLTARRLQRARHLLEQHACPLVHIVALCGFKDVSSFIRLFRNTYGITPTKYRQSKRESKLVDTRKRLAS